MKKLLSETYTCYLECESYGWIVLSSEQFKNTTKIIEQLDNKLVSCSGPGNADYLINGNLLRTNHATFPNLENGWSFKIHPESQTGLENLAEFLSLPLEK